MNHDTKYVLFGLVVLAGYWFTVHHGIVFDSPHEGPSFASSRGSPGARWFPIFWSTGYQGGK